MLNDGSNSIGGGVPPGMFRDSYLEKPKTKERTVAYVIQKVTQWRRLYNGYYDKDFNHQRLSLEDAAE